METETELFSVIEGELDKKLTEGGFEITETRCDEKAFGSRFTVWKSTREQLAIRLAWDGKESWFIIEESPFDNETEPISWADLVIVPYDRTLKGQDYDAQVLKDVVDQIK